MHVQRVRCSTWKKCVRCVFVYFVPEDYKVSQKQGHKQTSRRHISKGGMRTGGFLEIDLTSCAFFHSESPIRSAEFHNFPKGW
jgi:hypothetical protein